MSASATEDSEAPETLKNDISLDISLDRSKGASTTLKSAPKSAPTSPPESPNRRSRRSILVSSQPSSVIAGQTRRRSVHVDTEFLRVQLTELQTKHKIALKALQKEKKERSELEGQVSVLQALRGSTENELQALYQTLYMEFQAHKKEAEVDKEELVGQIAAAKAVTKHAHEDYKKKFVDLAELEKEKYEQKYERYQRQKDAELVEMQRVLAEESKIAIKEQYKQSRARDVAHMDQQYRTLERLQGEIKNQKAKQQELEKQNKHHEETEKLMEAERRKLKSEVRYGLDMGINFKSINLILKRMTVHRFVADHRYRKRLETLLNRLEDLAHRTLKDKECRRILRSVEMDGWAQHSQRRRRFKTEDNVSSAAATGKGHEEEVAAAGEKRVQRHTARGVPQRAYILDALDRLEDVEVVMSAVVDELVADKNRWKSTANNFFIRNSELTSLSLNTEQKLQHYTTSCISYQSQNQLLNKRLEQMEHQIDWKLTHMPQSAAARFQPPADDASSSMGLSGTDDENADEDNEQKKVVKHDTGTIKNKQAKDARKQAAVVEGTSPSRQLMMQLKQPRWWSDYQSTQEIQRHPLAPSEPSELGGSKEQLSDFLDFAVGVAGGKPPVCLDDSIIMTDEQMHQLRVARKFNSQPYQTNKEPPMLRAFSPRRHQFRAAARGPDSRQADTSNGFNGPLGPPPGSSPRVQTVTVAPRRGFPAVD